MTHAEVIADALAALTRGDLKALLDVCFAPEIEIVSLLAAIEGQSHFEGREGAERWYETILAAWSDFEIVLEDVMAVDELAVTLQRMSASGRGSGAEVSREIGVVYRIRAERIHGLYVFPEPADAFEEMARQLRG